MGKGISLLTGSSLLNEHGTAQPEGYYTSLGTSKPFKLAKAKSKGIQSKPAYNPVYP